MNNMHKLVLQKLGGAFRYSTYFLRPLPDFIILGAMKSGSTSLFDYITQHPDVRAGVRKELNFFSSKNYSKGTGWYRAYFPAVEKNSRELITGESTPYYLCHPHSAERIHKHLPNIKFIAVLRNPTERAISHYFHEVRKQREHLDIMEAFNAEESRMSGEWELMIKNPDYYSLSSRHFSYKKRGVYIDQLEKYWTYFKQDQIMVLSSEELFTAPQSTLKRVFEFLNIDPEYKVPDLKPKCVGTNRTDVDSKVYDYLDEYFHDYNRLLYKAIGEEFNWQINM